jgi:hypothetical protein
MQDASALTPAAFHPRELRARPRWLEPMLLTAALYAAMVPVYSHWFGTQRIAEGTAAFVERSLEVDVGKGAPAMIRERLEERGLLADAASSAALTLAEVVLSGMLLNLGALALAGADVTARQSLAIASWSALGTAVLRIAGFFVVTLALGRDDAAGPDWWHVAQLNLDVFPDAGPLARTFLAACDFSRVAGLLLCAAGLRIVVPRLGWPLALAASLGWTALVVLMRMGTSALLGVPIV